VPTAYYRSGIVMGTYTFSKFVGVFGYKNIDNH